jgi:hypothetical protein
MESINTNETDNDNDGKALESHEIIELQAFSERKAWIIEKIEVSDVTVLSFLFLSFSVPGKNATDSCVCRVGRSATVVRGNAAGIAQPRRIGKLAG